MTFRIDREALPFAAVLALASALAALLLPPWTAALPLLLLAFTLWFFRDPERRAATGDDAAVIAPADGRIIRADGRRLSVFMNVLDVHVCRAPTAGRVLSVRHTPGRFLAAFRDDASEHNERTEVWIEGERGRVGVTLVAGLIARRIVCRIVPGERLAAGQRIGLIRFGSRVDVELPEGARHEVALGARVRAGETILGRLGAVPPARPARPETAGRPASLDPGA